jgi:hypothetical protein
LRFFSITILYNSVRACMFSWCRMQMQLYVQASPVGKTKVHALTCLVVKGKMHDMILRYTASTATVHDPVFVVKQKLHEPVCIAVH